VRVAFFEGKSMREQAAEVSRAAVLVGVHGAAFTNLVFLDPQVHVHADEGSLFLLTPHPQS
jgi:capsular polysaccharide biosynthesis protein